MKKRVKNCSLKSRKVGQPKKEDKRISSMKIMMNNSEKNIFVKSGLMKSHILRKWLIHKASEGLNIETMLEDLKKK